MYLSGPSSRMLFIDLIFEELFMMILAPPYRFAKLS